ncbi:MULTISPECIES: tRNA (cytidine(34)-2'-O)-methyltransferase [Brevibacterium]|jgi:tRNA (cytidine/uridine-2'-O-)-methyltransferase|uniref:Putative tRNA (cytidine(34)-2'-O)-methyltransferase n=2 Tax=Brevibacterium TaxID=1696 RepID=A0A0B9AD30_BRELN|nr:MULTISPECIES: tRNA (cytidine(34)-2'-O)-methyltransferase [Brevibacterium]AMT93980.1 RNA methyltransferase [Brevibacterium linens]KHS53480.1 S-adenosyl-L-methionine dependent tRNA/rRNA methyltransferase, SpoU [Brevibacterium linens]HHX47279.1 tRNA (cytidine(34)-2'-O)-methyltransferase [Brevibacterium sp.]HJE76642.1 tRNA (cytidine(34)-2'-O)-methyltransferase [Brevibacterium epidermidis]
MNIDIVFHTPEIPGNTGNAIRLAAVTGAHLHLVEPLGFDLSDAKLRRAGLDYHDLAHVTVHPSIDELWSHLGERRVIAFSTHTDNSFAEVEYQDGDVLLFGRESTGLPDEVITDDHVDMAVRIPMLPARRSLNLANSASIAIYEAWRQHGYAGA